MTIEFKRSGNYAKYGSETYCLYINGKSDGMEYSGDGSESGRTPWKIRQKHVEMLMQIECKDYPDELRIWNTTNYRMPPGALCVFGINRKRKKMEFEVWFGFGDKGKYDEKNWPLNPYLFIKKIHALSSGTIFKKKFALVFEESMDATFIFHTDLNGTIGDNFNMAREVLNDLVEKAERQMISETKKYLDERKIKF